MLFVFIIILGEIIFACLHISLEGLVAKFEVNKIPNKEQPSVVEGVRHYTLIVISKRYMLLLMLCTLQELMARINLFIYDCSSQTLIGTITIAIPLTFMYILQFCALYLAFQIRKVKVKGVNDTRNIAMVVYIVTTLFIIAGVVLIFLNDHITIYSVTFSSTAFMTATTVLGIIFIPKVY